MTRFNTKIILITGAGSGIGRATALAFAHEGAQVIAVDIGEAGLSDG
jgi:meso-butanediol dehydrogenase/(S,S)-butanediol dehydrogenase/diacetyl reductase